MQTAATTSKITVRVAAFLLVLSVTTTIVDCSSLQPDERLKIKGNGNGNGFGIGKKGRTILLGLMDKLVDFSELLAKQLGDKSIEQLDYCPIGDEDDDSELVQYLASTVPMQHDIGGDNRKQINECWLDALNWLKSQLLAIRMHLLVESPLADCMLRFARLARYLEDTCADIEGGSSSVAGRSQSIQNSWPLNEMRRWLISMADLQRQLVDPGSEEEIVRRLMKQMVQ